MERGPTPKGSGRALDLPEPGSEGQPCRGGAGPLAQPSPDSDLLFPGVPSACKQVVSVETTRDIEWATNTCTLGFHVFGKFSVAFVQFRHNMYLLLEHFTNTYEFSWPPVLSNCSAAADPTRTCTLQPPGEGPGKNQRHRFSPFSTV